MLLSIIIPTYNRNAKVDRILKELSRQITNEVEVIVVDDCSKIPYKTPFNWVKVINLKENSGGASVPRNIGLDNATGKYIAFIDSDDMIKPNYISKILEKTKEEWNYCYISWETKRTKVIYTIKLIFLQIFNILFLLLISIKTN